MNGTSKTTRLFARAALCAHLLTPLVSRADAAAMKDPLNYPLRQYAFILGISMLGGLVNWYARVRKGDSPPSIMALIGELCTSAFAGLLSFWLCAYFEVPLTLTAAIAGMVGHMGGRAIAWAEEKLTQRAERLLGDKP